MSEEKVFEKVGGMSLEQVRAMVEARLKAASDRAKTVEVPEAAEPAFWWNIYALGPWQPGAGFVPPEPIGPSGGPLMPHKVIRAGQTAYVFTLIRLNPFWGAGGLTACNLLSTASFQYQVNYYTSNILTMKPSEPTMENFDRFAPGTCEYLDILEFVPNEEGLYMMNITARIHDAEEKPMVPFAAFATEVWDFDWNLFSPMPSPPRWSDNPLRFMVYE